jgi:POT family proton-dependent oligopeptide transporter
MNMVLFAGVLVTLVTILPVIWQLRSHPRGLIILFLTEMWERFSYYGMRGLLIFYVTEQFLFSDAQANAQYGAYTTLVFLMPMIGGIVADRYLGTRKAVMFGALLLVFGHLTMAVEGKPAVQVLHYQNHAYSFVGDGRGSLRATALKVGDKTYQYGPAADGGLEIKGLPENAPLPTVLKKGDYSLTVENNDPLYLNFFFAALAMIVMGVGFLKASISSIVGQLYEKDDPRRDPGFTLYYYGINLGSFWAAVLCGWLGETYGWSLGFGAAGIGMLLGFLVFVIGRPMLQGKGEPPSREALKAKVVGPVNLENLIYILGVAGIGVLFFVVGRNEVVGVMLGVLAFSVLAYVFWWLSKNGSKAEWQRVFLALVLVAGATVFWTLFEQAGSSMNLFAQRNVNLDLLAHPIRLPLFGQDLFIGTRQMLAASGLAPDKVIWVDAAMTAAQTQSFNTGFILIFVPVFAFIWATLGKYNRDPNPVTKFGLGLLQVGLGFVVLVYGAKFADAHARTPLIFLALAYLLHTTGELCISPIGLSQITKLAPPVLISTLMSVWFLANSAAQFVGGMVAGLTGSATVAGQVLDPKAALVTTMGVFQVIGWAGIAVGVVFLFLAPFIKHWSNGSDVTSPRAEP